MIEIESLLSVQEAFMKAVMHILLDSSSQLHMILPDLGVDIQIYFYTLIGVSILSSQHFRHCVPYFLSGTNGGGGWGFAGVLSVLCCG